MDTTPESAANDAHGTPVGVGSDAAADTNIYITTHSDPASTPPGPAASPNPPPAAPIIINQPQPQPQPQPRAATDDTMLRQLLESRQRLQANAGANGNTTPPKHSIHWGPVLKGVAIVAGVVLAGVVAYSLAAPAAGWFMTQTTLGNALGGMFTPVVHGVSYGLSWAAGFIPHLFTMPVNFLASMATHLGLVNGMAATTASGVGSLAAGATVAGVTAYTAAPALEHLAAAHTASAQAAAAAPLDVPAPPPPPPVHDGWLSSLFPTKAAALNVPNPGFTSINSAFQQQELAHANHTAAEFVHHTMHDSEHHDTLHLPHFGHHAAPNEMADKTDHDDGAMPDTPDHDEAGPVKRRPWRDRMNPTNTYQHALQSTGSHGAAVRASQPQLSSTAPRTNTFAQTVNDDRARLDAALAESAR